MFAIVDYDAGNVTNVHNVLSRLRVESAITDNPELIENADAVILPGVGFFGAAMQKLNQKNLVEVVKKSANSGKPFLGICLGLQLLFEASEESEGVQGLGILKGNVKRFKIDAKVPQIGFNTVKYPQNSRLMCNLGENPWLYFVHSYYCDASENDCLTFKTEYVDTFDAGIEKDNLFAVQFHPEKSGQSGINLLKNFIKITHEYTKNNKHLVLKEK